MGLENPFKFIIILRKVMSMLKAICSMYVAIFEHCMVALYDTDTKTCNITGTGYGGGGGTI